MRSASEAIAVSSETVCSYCVEPFADGDEIERGAREIVHRECMIRMVVGSAAHQLGECSCFGGTRGDPPGATLRQAARVALDVFRELRHA